MLDVALKTTLGAFQLEAQFTAPAGITAVFGPSGSGKTSVVRGIAGLLACDHEKITLNGRDLSCVPPHRRKLGYVFQDARLFPHLTVLKNLRFGGVHNEEQIIALLGLGHLLDRYPAALSGGEAQRVALGRALMAGPELMLMDEPLSALDGVRKAEVLPYLEALREQADIPIVYVSHDMGEVARLAQHMVVLNEGRVVVAGPTDAVLSDPAAVPFVGVRDAGAVLTGRVVGHADDGLTKIETEAGALWVPGAVGRAGGAIRLRVPAQDIILSRNTPEGLSALNVLSVSITSLEAGKGPGVAVGLRAGGARLLARVTKRSAQTMGLAVGDQIFAIVKTTAIAPGDIG